MGKCVEEVQHYPMHCLYRAAVRGPGTNRDPRPALDLLCLAEEETWASPPRWIGHGSMYVCVGHTSLPRTARLPGPQQSSHAWEEYEEAFIFILDPHARNAGKTPPG